MGAKIPTLGIFILDTKHTEYKKGNKARMREVTFSKEYGRSVAAWNQDLALGEPRLGIWAFWLSFCSVC